MRPPPLRHLARGEELARACETGRSKSLQFRNCWEPVGVCRRRAIIHLRRAASAVEDRFSRMVLPRFSATPINLPTLASLTEEGKKLTAAARPLLRDRFCGALAKLPQPDQTAILDVLVPVAEMMQAPEIEEEPFLYQQPEP